MNPLPGIALARTSPDATHVASTPQGLAGWRVGAVLDAVVVDLPTPGRAALLVNGQRVQAETTLALAPGDRLALRVDAQGPPVLLRALGGERPAGPTPGAPDPVAPRSVQASGPTPPVTVSDPTLLVLPAPGTPPARDVPLETVVATLARVVACPASPAAITPPREALRAALQGVVDALPDLPELASVSGLRQAVASSGLFLESRLATGAPEPRQLARDLKGNLLRVADLLSKASSSDEPLAQAAARTESRAPARTDDPGAAPARPAVPAPPAPAAEATADGTPAQAAPAPTPALAPATAARTPAPAAPGQTPGPAASGQTPAPVAPAQTPTGSAAHVDAPLGTVADALANPEALLARVESGIARLEQNQIRSLPRPDGSPGTWHVELPLRTGQEGFGSVSLTLEPDPEHRGRGDNPGWSVSVRLSPEPLGPMQARVVWRAGAVSAALWAERPATVNLLRRKAPELEQALSAAGVRVEGVRCVPVPPTLGAAGARSSLLDLRA